LRFYADMVVLHRQLRPADAMDQLGLLALGPARDAVSRWLGGTLKK
jgi:hypothetical protein